MSIVVFPEDPTTRNKRLKFEERQAIADWLLKESKEGKLIYGSLKQAGILFNKSRRTILRIWKQCKSSVDNGTPLDVSSKLVGRVGRKRVEVDFNQVKETPLCRRTNIRSLAFAMNMAKSTVFWRIKDGTIRTHTNSIKPQLTEQNKKSERYYLLPEEHEPDPYRSCKSKNFIPKVMFMAAVARPRFDENGIELFFGKIGIFPFVVKEPAKRNSKNRTAGTLETKPILSVTKDITTACLIEKVLPAIRSKWPASDSNIPIFKKQDNARPHIGVNDLEFVEATQKDGFDIRLCFQPPNSPDLNLLDLGFFRAIQSLQYQKAPSNVDELVEVVERSFDEMKVEQLNHVFLTLQSCMIEVMKDNGGNNYKVPHLNKNRLEREDNLPLQLCCDIGIVNHVSTLLQQ
ncbi:hypothetical protein KY290_033580 [Solanum tuberosum]|uniref:DUF7769 domain-containing protein n=1 Tax=Solanum tuberosum TaxID=4113 RepID=A0ABQ7U2L2_SOLTU|nr:hypothetical protein KY289_032952 [Solanum tuberosum]KAH0647588.1 hypothetical protein KY285_032836 [Solanum tuberosum]KAH0740537.1 hypothetical protein KY290_033580 [Solanum tuberosum]